MPSTIRKTLPAYPIDLTSPGAIDQLLLAHRARFGDSRMDDGDGDGGDGGSGDGDGGDAGEGGDGKGDGDGKDDDLGDAGQAALQAERTSRQAAEAALAKLLPHLTRSQIRSALRKGGDALQTLQPKTQTKKDAKKDGEDQVDVEQARQQARDEALREATEKANVRIVSAEVRALAAELFADPADAPLYLDLSQYDVDDDGQVDVKAIKTDLQNVLKAKPHLAKKGAKPKPDRSQGPKGATDDDVQPGRRRLAAAYAASGNSRS